MEQQIELSRFPALPEVLARLIQELNNEQLNLADLSGLILHDAAISMKILAVANSSFYNRRTQVTSVHQGISLIGLKMVRMLAISASMHQFLLQTSGMSPASFGRYWQHALLTAGLAKSLAAATAYPNPDEAYLAGLLHDIGQMALWSSQPEAYGKLLARHHDDEALIGAEIKTFGIDHCELGAVLAERWQLEPLLADAIRYHHAPADSAAAATELVRIVNAANALSLMGKQENHPALALAHHLLGLPEAETGRLHAEALASLDIVAMVFAIDTQEPPAREKSHPAEPSPALASQLRLQEEVHATTLLSLAREDYGERLSENDLLADVVQSAYLLFEPRRVFLFELDAQANRLAGRAVETQDDAVTRIRMPLEAGRSLVADALLQQAATANFGAGTSSLSSMLDQQLLRLAGAKAMCCVPLCNRQLQFGVLVLAYDTPKPAADARMRFIEAYARQAADALLALRSRLQQEAINATLQAQSYQLRARQVVHEANNPLAILKNYLTMLDLKLADSQPVTKELQVLNEEIDRVAGIIRGFAAAGEAAAAPTGLVDVNALLQDLLAVCERAMFTPANIRTETRFDKELPLLGSDPAQLKQVFVNLFKNAAEAMTKGGTLRVSTALSVGPQQTKSVVISIADDGPGMPPEILEGLFSTVRTTKGAGGSGLGLTITANVVRSLGGDISCSSKAGQGTVFDIRLPCGKALPASRSDG